MNVQVNFPALAPEEPDVHGGDCHDMVWPLKSIPIVLPVCQFEPDTITEVPAGPAQGEKVASQAIATPAFIAMYKSKIPITFIAFMI
jgi:hypothetical protein